MNDKELKLEKKYYSVISNDLIRHHQSMTLREMQLLQLVISNVVKTDDDFYTYTTTATKLSKFLGIKQQSLYRDLDELTDKLMKRIIKDTVGSEVIKIHWVDKCTYNTDTKLLTIRLHTDLKPYLLDLKRFYSKINVETLITFKSYYTLRIYQIIVCEHGAKQQEDFYFSCDELRTLFEIPKNKYKLNADLIKRTIKAALDELNESDYCHIFNYVEDRADTRGKPLQGVSFSVFLFDNKEDKKAHMNAYEKYKDLIEPPMQGQLSFLDDEGSSHE